MRTSESSASAHFQKLRFFASFAIASVITFVLELGIEHSIRTGEHQDLTHSIFGMSDIYQRIVTAGVRKPVPRYTVIVEINPEKDPSAINLHHICRQRQFLSELVKAIASANPAVIAIDGYFEKQQCPGNGTSSLLETLEEVGKTTPVVIGRAIDEKTRAIDGRTPVLLPTLPLPIDQEHMLEEGVINIGLDTRKLPLQWKVLNGRFENNPEFIWRETLPLVAAKAYEPGLLNKHQRLQRFLNEKEHPFVSFLQESRFTVYQASQVINAPQHIAQKHGRQCFPDDNGPVPKRCLRGKIVIVGEAHPMDRHDTVVGNLPGMVLHANYIEALLDERYFKPIPWLDYIFGFLLFYVIELIWYHHAPWRALLWGLAVITGAFVLLSLLVVHVGWYINPVAISLLALIIRFSHLLLFPKAPSHAREGSP